jgi:hypothetical protein
LWPRNHFSQVGILILGHSWGSLPFGDTFDAALFLILLLLSTKLLSAAFFQLVAPIEPANAADSLDRPAPSGQGALSALKTMGAG